MNIVLFEDPHVERLSPITLSRPAYAVTCGALRLIDLAPSLGGPIRGVVRRHLTDIQGDYITTRQPLSAREPTLLLNARLAPSAQRFESLRSWARRGVPGRVARDGVVLMALLPAGSTLPEDFQSPQDLQGWFRQPDFERLPAVELDLQTIDYPHELIAIHEQILRGNLEYRISQGAFREAAEGVLVGKDVALPQQIAFDTTNGPILLEHHVDVGPFCFLQGPMYAGRGAHIRPHTHLKGWVSLGHTTKVGGEVGRSIVEAYSNKQHFGYLGHAYLGNWVNLGAGTTNSNLKNTYGTIHVEYDDVKVDTGLQFFGCVVGDYSKTAINTSIYTGKLIGVCSNVYGTVTTNVPSFTNYARSFGQLTELPPDVMETTQRRMFSRRGLQQRPCDVQLLRDIYQLVSQSRELANQPPSL